MSNNCYHCGLPNPTNTLQTEVLGQPRDFCCPGCRAVAQAICANGLDDYYRYRTENAQKADEDLRTILQQLKLYDDPSIQQDFVSVNNDLAEIQVSIEGITCAACGWLIERHLMQINGVKQIAVNVSTARALIKYDPQLCQLSTIFTQAKQLGYHLYPFSPAVEEVQYRQQHKRYMKQLGLAGLFTMQVMMFSFAFYFDFLDTLDEEMGQFFRLVSLLLTLPVVLYSGQTFYRGAWMALKNRTVNMDVPVTIAVLGTFLASVKATFLQVGEVYFESICMFIFFLLISRFVEHKTRLHAAESSANLIKQIPLVAHRVNAVQQVDAVLVKHLQIDDVVLVKIGEVIPCDGVLLSPLAEIDEALVTGEFALIAKLTGEQVYGGSVNHTENIHIRVTRISQHSLINQILKLQQQAMQHKPKVALLADQISQYFVLGVLLIASLTYTWHYVNDHPDAIWFTVAVLIATCPCALGLATPAALTTTMQMLNKQGILLKQVNFIQAVTKIDEIVCDKTGTLTKGQFTLTGQHYLQDTNYYRLAASLESYANHPIASAFPIDSPYVITDIKQHPGYGLQGTYQGMEYFIGSQQFLNIHGPAINDSLPEADIYLFSKSALLAYYHLADSLKDDIAETLAELPLPVAILSGDKYNNVQQVAKQLGVSTYYAECSPAEKLAVVTERQQQHNLLLLGDGINDAPMLAQAYLSVAVGNASDIAKNAADIIFLNDDMHGLNRLFKQAQRTQKIIKQNFAWALGYNALVLPLAVTGLLAPWMAALGMSASAIIVVLNSLRLKSSS